MNNQIAQVNEVLSRLYHQPVKAGYTNDGWAVVLKATTDTNLPYKEEDLVDGGIHRNINQSTARLLAKASELFDEIQELKEWLDDDEKALFNEEKD